MTTNTCNDYVNFIGQLFTGGIDECARDMDFHVFRHHLLALKRK